MAKLFAPMQAAFQTQYAEVRERAMREGNLLEGTPGALVRRAGTGHAYWYRVFYPNPGVKKEVIVCKDGDDEALQAMRFRMDFADWIAEQVPTLRKLGFQVADKLTARVLVELHNRGAFRGGMVLVGTLAYMSHMNELGAMAVSSRTMDIDVARNRPLKLAAPLSFFSVMKDAGLAFTPVPDIDPRVPATSVKLPGLEGPRVDVLVAGDELGAVVPVPELQWSAQSVPYYQYLLDEPVDVVALAGWQAIPVKVPQPARMVWHKLYSSVAQQDASKRAKDFRQAVTLAAALMESDPVAIRNALDLAPRGLVARVAPLAERLRSALAEHPEAADALVG